MIFLAIALPALLPEPIANLPAVTFEREASAFLAPMGYASLGCGTHPNPSQEGLSGNLGGEDDALRSFEPCSVPHRERFVPADPSIGRDRAVPADPFFDRDLGAVPAFAALDEETVPRWSLAALRSLERLVEAPGSERRSPLDRIEFATRLKLLFHRLHEGVASPPTPSDLQTLQRLQGEFAEELASLQADTDALEETLDRIAGRQFSVTSKLNGEVIVAASGLGRGRQPNDDSAIASNVTLGNRIRLNFDTSFRGNDRLRIRLQSTNIGRFDRAAETDLARFSFQGEDNGQIELARLEYLFRVGRATVYLEGEGASLNDFTNPLNPLSSSGRGAISRFGQRNPIYRQVGGSGLGVSIDLSRSLNLGLGYLGDSLNDPDEGLARSNFGAIAQLTFRPNRTLALGLAYIRAQNGLDTNTGSELANDPFDGESRAIASNSLGLQASVALNPDLALSGWIGFTRATARDLPDNPSAEILNWAIAIALRDLGGRGNLLGAIVGQPPYVTSNDLTQNGQPLTDDASTFHAEVFYRYQLNRQVAISPGFFAVFRPEGNGNDTLFAATVRSTFRF